MSRKKRFRPARCRPEKTRRKNHAVCRTGAAVRPVGNRVRPDVRRKSRRRKARSAAPDKASAIAPPRVKFQPSECSLSRRPSAFCPASRKRLRQYRKPPGFLVNPVRGRAFPGTRAKFPRRAEKKGIRGFSVRRGCLFLFLFFRQRDPHRVLRAGAAENAPLLRVFTARTSPGIPRMPRGIPDSRSLRTGASCACRGCAVRCPAHSRQCWSSGR